MIDENVKKVPRRLVGCRGDGTFEPSGVVGELGTVYACVFNRIVYANNNIIIIMHDYDYNIIIHASLY